MTAKMPMSGSPEKRRDCIVQLPLRSPIFYTRVKLRHYADSSSATTAQLGDAPLPVPPDARPSSKHQRRAGRRTSPSRNAGQVPHLLLRELRGEVLEKLPPRLEIALHCNEHSSRNVLTAKKAGPMKLPKNKAIPNSASGRASRSKQALEQSPPACNRQSKI